MFPVFLRLSEQYRSVVQDLVMSLQALASNLRKQGITATCYVCDDGWGEQVLRALEPWEALQRLLPD